MWDSNNLDENLLKIDTEIFAAHGGNLIDKQIELSTQLQGMCKPLLIIIFLKKNLSFGHCLVGLSLQRSKTKLLVP